MSEEGTRYARADVFPMLISVGLFAYFGFAIGWAHQYTNTDPPRLLLMVALLKWTLRGGALAFGFAAILAMRGALAGSLIYAVTGLVTALIFVAVAIWDWSTPWFSGVHPVLLLIFAAWNGYGSWTGLQAVLALRAAEPPRDTFAPPS